MSRMFVEEAFTFDFEQARKQEGGKGAIRWENTVSGDLVWLVNFWILDTEMVLEYLTIEGDPVRQTFPIENKIIFGNKNRPYVVCDCGETVNKLYATSVGGEFTCRTCANLVYDSDQRNKISTLRRDLNRLTVSQLVERVKSVEDTDELLDIIELIGSSISSIQLPWREQLMKDRYGDQYKI